MELTIFETLFIAHLVGDYLFQNGWQALNKAKGKFFNLPLLTHCTLYTLAFVPVFWFWHVPLVWLAAIFGTHMFIDRRWPIIWLMSLKESRRDGPYEPPFWLLIMVDQIVHLLVLVGVVVFSSARPA